MNNFITGNSFSHKDKIHEDLHVSSFLESKQTREIMLVVFTHFCKLVKGVLSAENFLF